MKSLIGLFIFIHVCHQMNAQSFGQAQACQDNINSNANFNELKAATFRFQTATGECTGTLLNRNTGENSIGQFFLTSWHCLNDLTLTTNDEFQATLTFNFQSPDNNNLSTPVNNRGLSNTQSPGLNNNGYRYRLSSPIRVVARTSMVQGDMAICEILNPIPPHFNVYYMGWSPSPYLAFTSAPYTSFHHERGDIKKVSTSTLPIIAYNQPASVSCHVVTAVIDFLFGWLWKRRWSTQVICNYIDWPMMSVTWTVGNTSPGSSGASLFLPNGKAIGNLSTGWIGLSCNAILRKDNYGKFSNYYNRQAVKNLLNPPNKWAIDQSGIPGRKINCYQNLFSLTGEYFPTIENNQFNPSQVLSAQDFVITNNRLFIYNQANFSFNAGRSVELNPGFQTETGAVFAANIAPCAVNNNTYRVASNDSRIENESEYETPDFNKVLDSMKIPKYKKFEITKYINKNELSVKNTVFLKSSTFPNPASNLLNVNAFFKSKVLNATIAIYDINGKLLMRKTYSNLYLINDQFNVSQLQSGMYNLTITADKEIVSKRFVVAK